MPFDDSLLTGLKLEFAYFTGRAWNGRRTGGAGAVLRFARVRERRGAGFQPLASDEITPGFLDRMLRALKRWNFDVVDLDEVCRRAVTMPAPRRFVSLTFDGAYKDLVTTAYPVLSRHRVPFAVYVPTAFADGLGEAWWLALEAIIGRETRVSLVIDRGERHFGTRTQSEKHEAFRYLEGWMRSLPPREQSVAIRDLCGRYSVDLARLSREASMDWADLARLAADPLVTIGSATVNYPVLANLKDDTALREMSMGRAVAEAALRREVKHFAYPFGDVYAWRRAHRMMAGEAGFISAASTIPGVVQTEGRTDLLALPRIAWDGRRQSLRILRVLLSGGVFAPAKPAERQEVGDD